MLRGDKPEANSFSCSSSLKAKKKTKATKSKLRATTAKLTRNSTREFKIEEVILLKALEALKLTWFIKPSEDEGNNAFNTPAMS